MPDIAGNSSTTSTISVGGTVTNELEIQGDHDWFKITLAAGQSITVTLNGITLEDPYLIIRGPDGNLLFEDDDIVDGIDRDSSISFTASTAGTYYIDVAAWQPSEPLAGYTGTGTYKLTVSNYTPPPYWTNDQIVNQLTTDFWGDGRHSFELTSARSISVNLTGLTPEAAALARVALAAWSEIIGVSFPEVSVGGHIIFDDNESGANTGSDYNANGSIFASYVNIEPQWLTDYGSTVGSYGYQTYLHEIGHALGLGHAGNYNGDARYPFDALFQNDSWATSVMSYFSQTENTYTAGQGFTYEYLLTPMVADIIAIQQLYGAGSARTGDTAYGVGGAGIYAAANFSGPNGNALTIYDTGGNDTIDFSNMSIAQTINLNAEAFSSVGSGGGNLSIARGTIIENATGGSGNDSLIGNSVANVLRGNGGSDTYTGGPGGDTFLGTRAQLSGDTITDFSAGDKIVFSDATTGSFIFSVTGNTLNFSGGSLTLQGGISGTLVASAAAGGGVQLALAAATVTADVRNDFNGDGRSDILWRSTNGTVMEWLGQADGSFAYNPAISYQLPLDWKFAASGDFNGDGRDDILWRSATGGLIEWLGQANGTFAYNAAASNSLGTEWQIVGAGDFNGDSRDDLIWRSSTGTLTSWLGQANGSFVASNANYALGTGWQVAATGDFNGDGKDDLVLRHTSGNVIEWLGQSNGSFAFNPAIAYALPTNWVFAGAGDFNNDNRDDVLWRNAQGTVIEWLGQTDGTLAFNSAGTHTRGTDWHIVGTGDFNGDNFDDVMWRNDNGTFNHWLGHADGSFSASFASYTLPLEWHVQPDSFWV